MPSPADVGGSVFWTEEPTSPTGKTWHVMWQGEEQPDTWDTESEANARLERLRAGKAGT